MVNLNLQSSFKFLFVNGIPIEIPTEDDIENLKVGDQVLHPISSRSVEVKSIFARGTGIIDGKKFITFNVKNGKNSTITVSRKANTISRDFYMYQHFSNDELNSLERILLKHV